MTLARLRTLLLAMLLACLATSPLAADSELRVIALKHRMAADMASAVQPLLGSGESVSSVDNKLIVRAAPRTLAQVERLLAQIDVPRRNLRISMRHGEAREETRQRGGVSGDYHAGDRRISIGGERPHDSGVTIRRNGPQGNVQLDTERRVTTTLGSATHTLTVLDGGRAFLRIGESIPRVEPFLVFLGPQRAGIAAGVQFHEVTTGFEVEPRLVGDRIQLTIHPRLAFRGDQGLRTVDFQELRTEIVVPPGEWVDLGGLLESAHEVNRTILSGVQRTASGEVRLMVRVDPL
jgi:hypothetical protein